MKSVVKYEAEDGTLFDDEQACAEYENSEQQVKALGESIYNLMCSDEYNLGYHEDCQRLARDMLVYFNIKIK